MSANDISISLAPLAECTGRGMEIVVIDSGVHVGHPHIGGIGRMTAIDDTGHTHDDVVDRLGHGTAVAAAVHEKAPAATIHIAKVFHDSLSTNIEALVLAIDWAVEIGADLINLSLGTANPDNAPILSAALERVRASGAMLVAAAGANDRVWYPGALEAAFSVALDPTCPRDALRIPPAGGHPVARASGFARPIPGVPPERNLNGVSFSVANATGILARLLEHDPSARDPRSAAAALSCLAVSPTRSEIAS